MTNLREEMAKAEQAIVRGGGFTSQQSIEAANRFFAALGKLEQQFGRMRDAAGAQIGAALTPAIQQVTAYIGQNMTANIDVDQKCRRLHQGADAGSDPVLLARTGRGGPGHRVWQMDH